MEDAIGNLAEVVCRFKCSEEGRESEGVCTEGPEILTTWALDTARTAKRVRTISLQHRGDAEEEEILQREGGSEEAIVDAKQTWG